MKSKETINIEKLVYNINDKEYNLYLTPGEYNSTGFYIQRKNSGIISFCIGVEVRRLGCSVEDFIDDNIKDWVEDYEQEIEKLETI